MDMLSQDRAMSRFYLDYSATTPVLPEIIDAMRPYWGDTFGNPASAHWTGRKARQALEDAREQIAALLGAYPDELIFTSGATEANNLAIFGLADDMPGHVISSAIEHPCVIGALDQLAARGFEIEHLPVNREGLVEFATLPESIRPDTRLVSAMRVNHETGAVQNVPKVERYRVHCDAAQAVGKIPVQFHAMNVTAMTISAHKIHGPKGIGALLLRRGVKLRPMFFGGHQQQGHRPGTEPVALAVGMAKSVEIAVRNLESNTRQVHKIRERFLSGLSPAAPMCVNGPSDIAWAVPHIINVSFPGCRADALLMALDLAGVSCSTGSACSSGSLLPSPVLKAMGVPDEVLRSAMRFSFSHLTSDSEIDEAAERIVSTVRRLRDHGGN